MDALEHVHRKVREALRAMEEAQECLAKAMEVPVPELRAEIAQAMVVPLSSAEVGKKVGLFEWTTQGARDGMGKAATELEVLESLVDDLT